MLVTFGGLEGLQWLLSSFPKVAIVERFNYI